MVERIKNLRGTGDQGDKKRSKGVKRRQRGLERGYTQSNTQRAALQLELL